MPRIQLTSNTEDKHQMALFTWVEQVRARLPELKLLHHIPNGGERNEIVAKKLKAMGTKAGVPDLCLPVARGGFFGLYIEMKRPAGPGDSRAGTTTPKQRQWIEDLRGQGYRVEVAFGWEQAAEFLQKYLAQIPTFGSRAVV